MEYDPGRDACPLPFSPFKSCTVPRPIGWLSSMSADGVANLAPYSQWQNLTFDPPMVMFAANRYPDGRRKDTVVNAEATGWFVWNMATWSLREAVNISAMALAPEEDEFIRAGVNKAASVHCAAPRVAEVTGALRVQVSVHPHAGGGLSRRHGGCGVCQGRAHPRGRCVHRGGWQTGHRQARADRPDGLLRLHGGARGFRDAHTGCGRRSAGGARRKRLSPGQHGAGLTC